MRSPENRRMRKIQSKATFGGIDHDRWLDFLEQRPPTYSFEMLNNLGATLEEKFTGTVQEKVDLSFPLSNTFGTESSI